MNYYTWGVMTACWITVTIWTWINTKLILSLRIKIRALEAHNEQTAGESYREEPPVVADPMIKPISYYQKRVHYKPELINKMLKDYRAGMTARNITKKYNISSSYFYKVAARYGFSKTHRKNKKPSSYTYITQDQANQIVFFYNEGMPATQIAKRFNVKTSYVYHVVKIERQKKAATQKDLPENEIRDRYFNQGKTMTEVRKEFNITRDDLVVILSKKE